MNEATQPLAIAREPSIQRMILSPHRSIGRIIGLYPINGGSNPSVGSNFRFKFCHCLPGISPGRNRLPPSGLPPSNGDQKERILSVVKCPKCSKETNSVWIDEDGCYLIPVPDETGILYWRRGCIPADKLDYEYMVPIAKKSKDKKVK